MLYDDLRTNHYLDPQYLTASNDSYGTQTSGFNCDNPSLFSAEAMLLCGWEIWPLYTRFFEDAAICNGAPGFMHRYPGDTGNISVDELIGAATLDWTIAGQMLRFARRNWWIFNAQGLTFSWKQPISQWIQWWDVWMWKFPNFKPYLIHQAEGLKWYQPISKLLWSLCCVTSVDDSGTSGPLLMWVQTKKMWGHYWLCDRAISVWRRKMMELYPGGLQQMMTIYFGVSHPFVNYASGKDFS